jgi:ABC-type multidrug transport system ATPase subunit
MRQRLALARALLTDPPILLLDEPTRGIDPVATAFFGRLFRGLAQEQRKTIVLVTHDLRAAAELCDRVAVMDGGRIVEIGSPAAVDAMVRAEP